MYVVLAVLISLDQIFTESIKSFERAIWIILIIIFVLTIYFLSSRAGVIAVLIVVPVYMYNKIKKKMMRLILIIFFPIFIFSVFVLLKTNTRFYYSFEKIIDRKPGKIIIKDQRLQIWKSAIGVIKRNLIIGVGTGDATYELKMEFKKRGYTEGYYENLNAHNQYLEVFLENGLIGLIIFLGTMGFMLYHAFVNQNIIYGLSIIMVMIFFIFETMLNRLAGVTFFPLFSFLLFHLNVGNKNSDFKENSSQS